jgi:predicted CXXCH cytochrome family protein
MRLKKAAIICIAAVVFGFVLSAGEATVVGSKHDFSTSSTNSVCVFCHTPHFASTTIAAPLWNRSIGSSVPTFTLYTSPTIDTSIGQPTGVSLACLSCHDAKVNAGDGAPSSSGKHSLLNAPGSGGIPDRSSNPNCQSCHGYIYGEGRGNWRLGLDMRNDHPISMVYPTVTQDRGFVTPPDLQRGWSDVPLYGGKVECATCHNVHDPSKTPFLRISNTGSALCYKCHSK